MVIVRGCLICGVRGDYHIILYEKVRNKIKRVTRVVTFVIERTFACENRVMNEISMNTTTGEIFRNIISPQIILESVKNKKLD